MLGFAYPISDLKKILSNYSTLDKQLMERLEEMDWFDIEHPIKTGDNLRPV